MPQHGTPGAMGLEFHVSRAARDRYQLDESLFSITGRVLFANFHAARVFAQKMNQRRDLVSFPEQAVRASQINAMGLIHELTHQMFRSYRQQHSPQLLQKALVWLEQHLGGPAVETALLRFTDEFPPVAVYRRELTAAEYLDGATDGIPNRQVALEELVLLWLTNANPAFAPFMELFDDSSLEKETSYPLIIANLYNFLGAQPSAQGGADGRQGGGGAGQSLFTGQNLIDLLLAPARAAPHSLEGQLEFIRERWGVTLGRQIYRLLGSLDLIKEEHKPVFFGPGPAEIPVYEFAGLEVEPERFTPDREWMPRLVMIAKNAYVWLDQLSKKYGRPIATLDQIPDEELDSLARWGITGLWLIGLWERSAASQRIKQLCGNADAVASAYSLFDYQIADKLGGEAACQGLRERAWRHGIRLASDMVPNHVGIDGRWVIEHPDWFVQSSHSPFPAYSFNGPNLSWDQRVGIYAEDHYYDRSDAAVVFKRVDNWSGEDRYVYHGNDGTTMPWNDTAQLNYLNPEVREAVIQTILHVARQFPIIRFDAAMTLAKKHYQRLWFPEPGSGGAIPSRAEHGLTRAQFDALMPEEFWREVVDRAATEAPDTLLLAEAFWLMESYFVRTLGMHRVYNSAFMNILRDEENAKYRTLMKNTLEFDPEILKRYVNFMNNPDERTAVDQFGKGDKYFGVCTLLATLPGLPMFGHGQVEGFTEKYGMEYQRAYWDEQPDPYLVQRHEREIFPLLHRRHLFAEVEHFLLYDFFTSGGAVDENVFAYSNRFGDEQALIVYHNAFTDTRGWVRTSAAYSARTGNGDERVLVQKNLGEGLGLHADDSHFCIFRDHVAGLEYIRGNRELFDRGLYVELGAYRYQIFLDFRQVQDNQWHQYAHLTAYLGGRGVPSIDEALKETFLQPIHYPFKELVNVELFRRLLAARAPTTDDRPPTADRREGERGRGGEGEAASSPISNLQSPISNADVGLEQVELEETARLEADVLVDGEGMGDADALGEGEPELEQVELGEAARLEADEPAIKGDTALLDEVEQKTIHLLREIKRFLDGDEAVAVDEAPKLEEPAAVETPAEGGSALQTALEVTTETAATDGTTAATAAPDREVLIAQEVRRKLETILELRALEPRLGAEDSDNYVAAIDEVRDGLADDLSRWGALLGWVFVHPLGKLGGDTDFAEQSRSWIDEWLLGRIIDGTLRDLGLDEGQAARAVMIIKRLTSQQRWFEARDVAETYEILEELLRDSDVQQLLGVNRHQGVLWFNRESFEQLLWWMLAVAVVSVGADQDSPADQALETIAGCYDTVKRLREAADQSNYQVEKLLELAQAPAR